MCQSRAGAMNKAFVGWIIIYHKSNTQSWSSVQNEASPNSCGYFGRTDPGNMHFLKVWPHPCYDFCNHLLSSRAPEGIWAQDISLLSPCMGHTRPVWLWGFSPGPCQSFMAFQDLVFHLGSLDRCFGIGSKGKYHTGNCSSCKIHCVGMNFDFCLKKIAHG